MFEMFRLSSFALMRPLSMSGFSSMSPFSRCRMSLGLVLRDILSLEKNRAKRPSRANCPSSSSLWLNGNTTSVLSVPPMKPSTILGSRV